MLLFVGFKFVNECFCWRNDKLLILYLLFEFDSSTLDEWILIDEHILECILLIDIFEFFKLFSTLWEFLALRVTLNFFFCANSRLTLL